MVGEDLRVPAADPHLVIEDPATVVPHLHQPGEPVPCLGTERGPAAVVEEARMVTDRAQHHRDGERGRAGELDEVAGIEPSARDVDRSPDPSEIALQRLSLVSRDPVHGGASVVQVCGLACEDGRVDIGAVALRPVEDERVLEQGRVEVRRGVDRERRRNRTGRREGVGPRGREPIEVDRADVRVGRVPGSAVGARGSAGHGAATVVEIERRSGARMAAEEERALGRRRHESHLVHADRRRGRRRGAGGGRCDERRGTSDEGRRQRQRRDRDPPLGHPRHPRHPSRRLGRWGRRSRSARPA